MKKIIVCINLRANPEHASCARRGGREIADRLERAISDMELDLTLEPFHCLGNCEEGPNIRLAPDGPFLKRVNPDRVKELLPVIRDFALGRAKD